MDALMSLSKLRVPEGLQRRCADVPNFGFSMKLVRLARWWNVWIGGSVFVVSLVVTLQILLLMRFPGGPSMTPARYVFVAVSLLVLLASAVVHRVGRRMPKLVAQHPVRLRPRLLLLAVCNSFLLLPLAAFLGIFFFGQGAMAGPGFTVAILATTVAALATPAVGVFANGFPWLRLGRAYDHAVAGYVPEAEDDAGADEHSSS